MKKFLVLFILALSTIHCSNEFKPENMQGTWVIEDLKANIQDLSPAVLEGGEKEAYSSVYEFLENDRFKLKSNAFPDGIEGSYELNLDSNYLKMNMVESVGSYESYKLSDIAPNNMTWTLDMGERGNVVFKVIRK